MPPGRRLYYVRVGTDVCGPVDEPTIAQWLAQGLARRGPVEVCPEGGSSYVPVAQTPFARFLPPPPGGVGKKLGVGTVIAIILFSLFGRTMRVCNETTEHDRKQMEAALPPVGAQGTLHRDGALKLCEQEKYGWGWPCGKGRIVADKSRVKIMKTGVFQMESLCRYWVQGGPDDGAAGDAPCAWFTPE